VSYDSFNAITQGTGCLSAIIPGCTFPWKLNDGISAVTDRYTTFWGWGNEWKRAIDHNLPCISLRTFNYPETQFQWHYRDIVGYKNEGVTIWFVRFSWDYLMIHDNNGYDGCGVWEAWNPLYQVYTGVMKQLY
jgi:hypothetical protein